MRCHNIPILFKLIWPGSYQQVGKLLCGRDSPRLRRNNERGILAADTGPDLPMACDGMWSLRIRSVAGDPAFLPEEGNGH